MKDPRYPYALELGSVVEGYRIDAVLGAGGFGVTYRATAPDGRIVAIKEFFVRDMSARQDAYVHVETGGEAGEDYAFALGKFREEADAIVHQFRHPSIIRGEGLIEANNTSYLVMDFVDGVTLEDWLIARKTPPAEAELKLIFEPIFAAVDYVHSHNVMHRDLTPRNIMLRRDGRPVLIDFGAAGQGIDRGRSSRMVAQVRYAPPEQSDDQGETVHGRYTDIFSLGGVLYRAVTGKAPMPPMTRVVRMGRAGGDGVDPHIPAAIASPAPEQYSPGFLAGIDRAMHLAERARPQSIDDLRRTLGWSAAAEPHQSAPQFDPVDVNAAVRHAAVARHLAVTTPDLPGTIMLPKGTATRLGGGADIGAATELGAARADEVSALSGRGPTRSNWVWGGIAAAVVLGTGLATWPRLRDIILPSASSLRPGEPDADMLAEQGWQAQSGGETAASLAEAMDLYDRAIARGSADACWNAAILLDSGAIAEADATRAATLLLKAGRARQMAAVEALTGDMAGFSATLRIATKRQLKEVAGFRGMMDREWDNEARRAALGLVTGEKVAGP